MKLEYSIIFTVCVLIMVAPTTVLADTVRTHDGITCSSSSNDSPFEVEFYSDSDGSDNTIGAKVKYKFGTSRLDCDALYKLELRHKEAKIIQLEQQVAALKAMGQINWEQ
jgi:hypothetical protein